MNKQYCKAKWGIIIPLCFLLISCNKEVKYNPIIPTDASVLLTINPSAIKNNILWDVLKKGELINPENLLNSIKSFDTSLTNLFVNAESTGISLNHSIYIFIKNQQGKKLKGISFFVNNEDAFFKYFSSLKKNEKKDYYGQINSSTLIYYSDHSALYLSSESDSSQISNSDLSLILNSKDNTFSPSLSDLPLTFTINGNYLSSLIELDPLTDNSIIIGSMDFSNDLLKFEVEQKFMNESPLITHRTNPFLIRSSEPAIFKANISLTPDQVYELLTEKTKKVLENMGITKELLVAAFAGDIYLSAGNPQIIKEKYITYELDDDFNTIEKWEYKEKKQEKFIMALAVKNMDSINMIVTKATQKNLLKQEGSLYTLTFSPTPVFLILTDSLMVITSDKKAKVISTIQSNARQQITLSPSLADSLFSSYIKDSTYKTLFNSIDSLSIQFEKPDPKLIKYKINIDLADSRAFQ